MHNLYMITDIPKISNCNSGNIRPGYFRVSIFGYLFSVFTSVANVLNNNNIVRLVYFNFHQSANKQKLRNIPNLRYEVFTISSSLSNYSWFLLVSHFVLHKNYCAWETHYPATQLGTINHFCFKLVKCNTAIAG